MAFDFLAQTVIQGVLDELVDVRQYSTNYLYNQRVRTVNALDGEVFARYRARIYAADIIALDGKAVIRSAPSIRLTQTEVPKLKHGTGFSEHFLKLLDRIEQNISSPGERGIFSNLVAQEVGFLVEGVFTRQNALNCAMLIDGLSYNRLGIQITGTWGMPSDLKVTLTSGARWNQPSTATPFDDVTSIIQTARQKYGIIFDRITMSTAAFNYMTATTSFITRAQSLFLAQAAIPLPQANIQEMIPIAQRVLGIASIALDDTQFWTEGDDGTETASRYLPSNAVLFDSTAFDGNGMAYDFANVEVLESRPGMVPNMIGAIDGGMDGHGPLGYVTASSPDGNPPGMNLWAVESGYPRKHKEAASAVLTIY